METICWSDVLDCGRSGADHGGCVASEGVVGGDGEGRAEEGGSGGERAGGGVEDEDVPEEVLFCAAGGGGLRACGAARGIHCFESV